MKPVRYKPADIDRALLALIIAGGNAAHAARTLKAVDGKEPPTERTLRRWADQHSARYAELQTRHHPRVAERIASDAEALAVAYAGIERKIITRLDTEVEQIPARDLSTASRNVAVAKAVQIDRLSSPLRGRPTIIHGQEDPREAADRLLANMGIPTITVTATDVT